MAYKRFYRRKPVRKYRKKRAIARKASILKSRPFKLAVKRVIHTMAENKYWSQVAQNVALSSAITGSTSATSISPWSINLLPQLSQGTGQSGRIGNKVRVVKSQIRGYVNLLPYNATNQTLQAPIGVKLYVFSAKSFTNFTGDMGYQNWQQFFQVNNNDTGFYGSMIDFALNVNNELYTLHATRTFQLSSWNTVGTSNQYQSFTNPYSVPFKINLTKFAKELKYDDANSSRVTNRSLIMCAQVCYADGTTNGYLVDTQKAEIHYVQEVQYEDL